MSEYLKDFCIKENKLYLLEEWETQLKSRTASLTRCPICYAEMLAEKKK